MSPPINVLGTGCGLYGSTAGLSNCSACKVLPYCSPEHQVKHRNAHKAACTKIKRARAAHDIEKQKLQDLPGDFMTAANPFETVAGHFWGVHETRPYMRAHYGLVEAILKVKNKKAVQAAEAHFVYMLRLCRSDNMGIRDPVPFQMLCLGKDQECYDFIKLGETCDPDGTYDWGDMDLPYLSVKDADVYEAVECIFNGAESFPSLSHLVAITLLKIKLLLDIQSLQNASMIGYKVPQEILDGIGEHTPATDPVLNNEEIARVSNQSYWIELLTAQVDTLYNQVGKTNAHYWRKLSRSGNNLTTRPS